MNSNCKEMEFLIQLFVDGEIKKDDQQRLKRHLNECRRCRNELVKLKQLVESLEQLGENERQLVRNRLLNLVKWAVVIATIILFSFTCPFHTNPVPLKPDENERKMIDVNRQLTIPESETIQCLEPKHWSGSISRAALLYPGAVPAFIKRKHSFKKTDQAQERIQKCYDNSSNPILQSSY